MMVSFYQWKERQSETIVRPAAPEEGRPTLPFSKALPPLSHLKLALSPLTHNSDYPKSTAPFVLLILDFTLVFITPVHLSSHIFPIGTHIPTAGRI